MKKLFLLLFLLLAPGCAVFLPDSNSRGIDRMGEKIPHLFLRLGQADQICVRKDGFAEVTVFVTLVHFPDLPPVELKINGGAASAILQGETVTWNLTKVGLGHHFLEVQAGGYTASRAFSVWHCEGF